MYWKNFSFFCDKLHKRVFKRNGEVWGMPFKMIDSSVMYKLQLKLIQWFLYTEENLNLNSWSTSYMNQSQFTKSNKLSIQLSLLGLSPINGRWNLPGLCCWLIACNPTQAIHNDLPSLLMSVVMFCLLESVFALLQRAVSQNSRNTQQA